MTSTPQIDDCAEAEQLSAKIRRLTIENAVLREHQSPAAGPMELQAENIVLRRETETLRQQLPEVVPYDGPLPETLAAFGALPAAHQRQVLTRQPEHVRRLRELDALLREADRRASREAERRAALGDADVSTPEQLAALPAEQRRQVVLKMTPQQRRALLGLPDGRDDRRRQGYL